MLFWIILLVWVLGWFLISYIFEHFIIPRHRKFFDCLRIIFMHIILSSLTITFFVLCYISINKYITKYRIVKNEKPIKEYIIQGVTKKQVKMNVYYYLIISYNNQIYDVLINREQCNDNSIQKMKLYYDKTHNEVFEAKKLKECHWEIIFVCFSIVVGFASVFRIYYYWKDRNERKRNIKRKKKQYNRAYTKNCQS